MSARVLCVDVDNVVAATNELMRATIREQAGDRVDLQYQDVVRFDYHTYVDRNGQGITRHEWDVVHRVLLASERLCRLPLLGGAREPLTRAYSRRSSRSDSLTGSASRIIGRST